MILVEAVLTDPVFYAISAFQNDPAEVVSDAGESGVSRAKIQAELRNVALARFDGGFIVVEVDSGTHLGVVLCSGEVAVWFESFAVDFLSYLAEDVPERYDVVPVIVAGYVAYKAVLNVEAVSEVYVVVLIEFFVVSYDIMALRVGLVF